MIRGPGYHRFHKGIDPDLQTKPEFYQTIFNKGIWIYGIALCRGERPRTTPMLFHFLTTQSYLAFLATISFPGDLFHQIFVKTSFTETRCTQY